MRALPHAHRAAHLAAVVVRDGGARAPAIAALEGATRPLPPGVAASLRDRVARGDAPDWCISRQLWWGHQLPIWYCPDGHLDRRGRRARRLAPSAARRSSRASRTSSTPGSRRRCGRSRRSAGRTRRPSSTAYYPGQRQLDRTRDHPPLGEPDDLGRASSARRGPVQRRDHPLDRPRADGRRMSKTLGTGYRPDGADREYGADATRYGLLKISSTQDVRFSYGAIEEGRKLAIKLWNVARLILQNAEGVDAGARPRDARGALDPRAPRGGPCRARGRVGALRLSPRSTARSTTSPSTTSATGTRKRSSPVCTTATRRLGDRARRARAHARAPPSRDAARVRGDLVAAPRPAGAAHRLAVARGGRRFAADAARARPRAGGGAIFRRSGVQVELGSDDERRIFAAVVRPERTRATATARRSSSGCARRSRARRACSQTTASCRTHRPTWSRPSGTSWSATAASWRLSKADA